MKQKKKFILITLSVITILLLLGFGTTRCYLSSKYKKIAERMRSDYKAAPNQQQLPLSFYLTFGYFPRSMDEALDFYHREIQPDESKETLRAQQVLQDPFSRDSCEIQYVPLYDYETKKPVSFILLSAGVDGKMDNKITPSDTLYLNNWWAKLDVYNYEEAVLLQDYWIKWEDLCRAYGEDIEDIETLLEIPETMIIYRYFFEWLGLENGGKKMTIEILGNDSICNASTHSWWKAFCDCKKCITQRMGNDIEYYSQKRF